MTLQEYLNAWLETYVQPIRRPNTTECYRRCILSIPPHLARVELQNLEPMAIQQALNIQSAAHERTAQLTYAVLHAALGRAVRLRMLPYSPMDACDKPQHKARKAEILRPEQLRAYLEAGRDSDCWPLLLLIATMGLRRGEALGLMWADIDGCTLHVQRQRIRGEAAPLKSASSDRRLQLPPPVMATLARWPRPIRGGWVVDTTPKRLYNHHVRVLQAAGLPHVTLHELRHSMATACVASGTTIKVLQAILGHSTYKLTADLYADHLTDPAYTADSLQRLCQLVL